jgi:flagellar biosynthesis protein FlhG
MPEISPRAPAALDQAAGLRRLFAGATRTCFVPLVSNPHVAFGGVLIERLVAAFAELRAHTLVVDASEHAPLPLEIAQIDLAEAIEPLASHASYLAGRGLPRRHLDARGSSASLLDALADAAPHADVVLVHASASDLWRMFARHAVRPVVLACDRPAAVTHAYAAIKLLALRAALMTHDLLLGAAAASPRAERIAMQLAGCAEAFVGATQCDWASIDPAIAAGAPPSPALRRLARGALALTAREQQAPALS